MTTPATREDVGRLTEAIKGLVESSNKAAHDQAELLKQIAESSKPVRHVQQVTVPAAPAPQRAERLVLIMGAIAAVIAFFAGSATTASILQGQRISDIVALQAGLRSETKAEVLAERESRERFEAWAAQEANTMRTFAKTGVLAPMKPRPSEARKKELRP